MARDLELEMWLEEDSKRPESVELEWWNWAWTLMSYARKINQRLGSIFEELGKEGCPTKEQLARIRKNVESGEFWFNAFKEPLDMFDKKVEAIKEYAEEGAKE